MTPSLNLTSGNWTAYRILAGPVRCSSASISEMESARLTASSSDATAKRWNISFEQLRSSLTGIIGKATTAELLECLRVGQIMTLPGTYTSYEVVKLDIANRWRGQLESSEKTEPVRRLRYRRFDCAPYANNTIDLAYEPRSVPAVASPGMIFT
jgi:hypothetical protein